MLEAPSPRPETHPQTRPWRSSCGQTSTRRRHAFRRRSLRAGTPGGRPTASPTAPDWQPHDLDSRPHLVIDVVVRVEARLELRPFVWRKLARDTSPYSYTGAKRAKPLKKTLAGSVGPSISMDPFRCDPALLVAAQTVSTRSNSLQHRQLPARTVTSSGASIASRAHVGVDLTDFLHGEARRARGAERHSSFDRSRPGGCPAAAGPVPMCPRNAAGNYFQWFCPFGGPFSRRGLRFITLRRRVP